MILSRRVLLKKTIPLILVAALLTARVGSFSHQVFVQPVQEVLFHMPVLTDGDMKPRTAAFQFKRIFAEAPLLLDARVSLPFFPPVPVNYPPRVEKALPEVYLKAFIPPA